MSKLEKIENINFTEAGQALCKAFTPEMKGV
jgi:hypothetical protein